MSIPVSIKAQLAEIGAKATNVGVARGLVGHATDVLSQGYAQLGSIVSLGGLSDATQALLDQCNAYAAKVYADLPTDDASQTRALTLQEKLRVAEVIRECSEATASAIDATSISYITWDDFVAGFTTVAQTIGNAAGQALKLGATGFLTLIWAFIRQTWWVLLIVVVVLVFVRRKVDGVAKAVLP